MDDRLILKGHEDSYRAIPETDQKITVNKLKMLLPKSTSVRVTEEMVELIHRMEEDSGLPQEQLEEDVLTHMHMLDGMRGVGVKDLINAIKYCNLKRNYDNKVAWAIVFPEKYERLESANKQVDNHVSMYNNNKLVTMIDKEMQIPVYMQYSTLFHAAVKKQMDIMNGKGGKDAKGNDMTVTPMVQHLAAKELTTLLKPPEEAKISINVNPGEAALSAQKEMADQLAQLVVMQRSRLNRGESIIDVQEIGVNFDAIGTNNE